MEFNVKIHCEINVKLVFHEILWKKNFTVYPSLNEHFSIVYTKKLSWNTYFMKCSERNYFTVYSRLYKLFLVAKLPSTALLQLFFTFFASNNKLFSRELEILNYDKIQSFSWMKSIHSYWLINIDWLADSNWLDDLTC